MLTACDYVHSTLTRTINKCHCCEIMHAFLFTSVHYMSDLLLFTKHDYNVRSQLLVDLATIDYPGYEDRFINVYNTWSLSYCFRILLCIRMPYQSEIPSITSVYKAAGWFERESWDMFGIQYDSHLDLRRILTDYGYAWHPLRRDYPLSGFYELFYDESIKCLQSKAVSFVQEFRTFTFDQVWNQYHSSVVHGKPDDAFMEYMKAMEESNATGETV